MAGIFYAAQQLVLPIVPILPKQHQAIAVPHLQIEIGDRVTHSVNASVDAIIDTIENLKEVPLKQLQI
nr:MULTISPECIES: hypothetical protein [Brasilonema]